MTSTVRNLSVLAFCGLLLAPPAALADNAQSPEITISSDLQDRLPQVAYNSNRDEYLVVWQTVDPSPGEVRGARVDHYGRLLADFVISAAVRERSQPAVAYDPDRDQYLVVWAFYNGTDGDVYGRLVPWDGPDPAIPEHPINTWASTDQFEPRVGYSRTEQEYMVMWTTSSSSGPMDISAQRVDAPSLGLIGGPFNVAQGSESRCHPDLAYDQARNEYLVVYEVRFSSSDYDVYAVRMTATGAILGGGEILIAVSPVVEARPAVSASRVGDRYVVAWEREVSTTDSDVRACVLNGDGTFDGMPQLVASTPSVEWSPEVACNPEGTTCVVAWVQAYAGGDGGLSARTLDLDHTLGAPFVVRPPLGGNRSPNSLALAAGRDGWLTTWDIYGAGTFEVIHGRVVFQLFADGFETGDPSRWSVFQP
jgi:hypothetical protein